MPATMRSAEHSLTSGTVRCERTRSDELEDPTTQRDVDLEAERLDAIEEGREAREAARQATEELED